VGKCFSAVNQGQRKKNDLYETPYIMTQLLLEEKYFSEGKNVLEPACGKSKAIVKVLKKNFNSIISYDLNYGQKRKDFLKETNKIDYIITNPPYSLANDFVIQAKKICTHTFAFLLRLNFLSGALRQAEILNDFYKYPLTQVLVFDRMPDLSKPIRQDGLIESTAMIVYAWFIWENMPRNTKRILPTIKYLSLQPYIVKKLRKKPIVKNR
jgi:hypothetical protein